MQWIFSVLPHVEGIEDNCVIGSGMSEQSVVTALQIKL